MKPLLVNWFPYIEFRLSGHHDLDTKARNQKVRAGASAPSRRRAGGNMKAQRNQIETAEEVARGRGLPPNERRGNLVLALVCLAVVAILVAALAVLANLLVLVRVLVPVVAVDAVLFVLVVAVFYLQ